MAEVTFRRARPGDVEFMASLATHEQVAPYLAPVRVSDADIARSDAEPEAFGRFVIEVDGQPAGTMGFERVNERSRIAQLGGLAVHPDFRGRRVADEAARAFIRHLVFELGFHRLQLEVYGFNERAMAHAERVGFTREGVKRKAYLRHGEWVDGVLFGLVEEDLVR
jgi:putative acetyltransferase